MMIRIFFTKFLGGKKETIISKMNSNLGTGLGAYNASFVDMHFKIFY